MADPQRSQNTVASFVVQESRTPENEESALEKAPLFSEIAIAEMLTKLTALEALMSLTTKASSFDQMMEDLLKIILNAVKSEAASVFEIDVSRRLLYSRAALGSGSDRLKSVTIPLGQGIVGHVAESRVSLAVDSVSESEQHLRSQESLREFEAKNIVALPILIRGQVYGVIEILNREGQSGFTSSDVALLNYLTKMVARVIEVRMMIAWVRGSRREIPSDRSNALPNELPNEFKEESRSG
jgi:signal transduction protein with GAF and PtsI domain